MDTLYLLAVWVHILAAIIWLGGLLFLVLVVVPWLKRGSTERAVLFLTETGERFRYVGWLCFAVLAATGTFSLWVRGIGLSDVGDPAWWSSPFGTALALKLTLFTAIVVVSAVHDFVIGPQATEALAREPDSDATRRLRRRASLLGRLNGVLALVVLAAAVVLVRGWPG